MCEILELIFLHTKFTNIKSWCENNPSTIKYKSYCTSYASSKKNVGE